MASLFPAPALAAQVPCYAEIVARYASGEREAAVAEIGRLSESDLKRAIKALRGSAQVGSATCTGNPPPISLPAALMLHTDRTVAEWSASGTTGGAVGCDASPQSTAAELVAKVVRDEGPRDVARRWTLAMALQTLGSGCLVEALQYVDLGLVWFKDDPQLLFARGSVQESMAMALQQQGEEAARTLLFQRSAAGVGPGEQRARRALSPQQAVDLQRRDHLSWARTAFEKALAGDPDLLVAALHLGRVLALSGEGDEARVVLGTLLGRAKDPSLLYLAHLFVGQLEQQAGGLAGAEREYRAALDVDPNGQAAAVALSHALLLAGAADDARDVLRRSLALGQRRKGDFYWGYLLGASEQADAILADLRREASPR